MEEGGETIFPELELAVQPETGKAIFWPNVTSDGRKVRTSLHGSAPVTKGEKWALVCWVRESPFGQAVTGPGISDIRGLERWLDPLVPMEPASWIVEAVSSAPASSVL